MDTDGFTVKYLKLAIQDYIDENNIKLPYKTKRKQELIDIINENNIDMSNYEEFRKVKKTKAEAKAENQNVLKRYGTRPFNEAEQKNLLVSIEQNKKSPLKAQKKYIDKEGNEVFLSLQEHQIKFIKQFIFSNLRGAIAFHGVGSGKTLTAVVCSYWFLKLYPDKNVLVITPASLLYNFVNGMKQFGLVIEDNRYIFMTYQKYLRNPKVAKNCLLIVDEAHNMRSTMNEKPIINPITQEKIGETSAINKMGYSVWKFGAMYCDKILLLTGTAFVNTLYDIENLIAMINRREPIKPDAFAKMLESPSNITDYFNYRISYYPSPKSEFFPEKKEEIVAVYMTEDMEEEYKDIKIAGTPNNRDIPSRFKNNFYVAEKYASNMVIGDDGLNLKVKWIIDKIVEVKTQKFIVYTGLYDAGIVQLEILLQKNNIEYKKITGRENMNQKESSKMFFNYYDFNKNNFFNLKDDDENKKYINNKYRVLLITKAGAEGIDTINCQNIVLLDQQWNPALTEQIVARAVRYKSHIGLPVNERYVNVYKILLCYEGSQELIKEINEGKIDWTALHREMTYTSKLALSMIEFREGKQSVPPADVIKKLTITKQDKSVQPFIPEISVYEKRRMGYGKKSEMVLVKQGWDYYEKLNIREKKDWRARKYAEYLIYTNEADNKESGLNKYSDITYSVDLRLMILSKSKEAMINDFISFFGNKISMFEQYESKVLKEIMKRELKSKKKLSDKEQARIYAKYFKNDKEQITQVLTDQYKKENRGRTQQERFQQYYTNDILAKYILTKSGIENIDIHIEVLEPTAGDGALIKPLMELTKEDINVDLIEIDETNRKKLQQLHDIAPNTLRLLEHKNFLNFIPSKRYDFVFTNPPFHLRKEENIILKKDVYDIDFIKRAYAMLKVGGKLIAITGLHFKEDEEMSNWLRSVNAKIEIRKKEKFSQIKIDIAIIEIDKETEANDNDILNYDFYNKPLIQQGNLAINNELLISDIKENKQEEKPLVEEKKQEIEVKEPPKYGIEIKTERRPERRRRAL